MMGDFVAINSPLYQLYFWDPCMVYLLHLALNHRNLYHSCRKICQSHASVMGVSYNVFPSLGEEELSSNGARRHLRALQRKARRGEILDVEDLRLDQNHGDG